MEKVIVNPWYPLPKYKKETLKILQRKINKDVDEDSFKIII
jgi:hypothetical protein